MNGNLIYTITKAYPNAVQRTLNYIGKSHSANAAYSNRAKDDVDIVAVRVPYRTSLCFQALPSPTYTFPRYRSVLPLLC